MLLVVMISFSGKSNHAFGLFERRSETAKATSVYELFLFAIDNRYERHSCVANVKYICLFLLFDSLDGEQAMILSH